MAFRFKLTHHPAASSDFHEAKQFFHEVDPDLGELFQEDFRVVLRALASGRAISHLYASGSEIRWVKLKRFSHKVFFDPFSDDEIFVLGVISGRRHPMHLQQMLERRKKPR